MKKKNPKLKEITDSDYIETTGFIGRKRLKFEDLGVKLPDNSPTQVVSIRLPTELLNQIKAYSSQRDVPYQAVIKLFLSEKIEKLKGIKPLG